MAVGRSARPMTVFIGIVTIVAMGIWNLCGTPVRGARAEADVAGRVDPAALETAKRYLRGYADANKTLLRNLTAKEPENYFGPCLFAQMPTLSNIRVDGSRAQVSFEGPATDPALPRKGTIALNFKAIGSDTTRHWRIRGIFWQGSQSIGVKTMDDSPTKKDEAKEPAVRAAVTKYINGWLKGDWADMKATSYDWLSKNRPLNKEIILRSVSCKGFLRPDGSVRVAFTVTASPRMAVASLLRRTATGTMYLVKESNEWKVRGITTSF